MKHSFDELYKELIKPEKTVVVKIVDRSDLHTGFKDYDIADIEYSMLIDNKIAMKAGLLMFVDDITGMWKILKTRRNIYGLNQ